MNQIFLILSFFTVFTVFSQSKKPNDPLAHTFSIVARDAKTGEMAVAVQSHWFSVGTAVPWGESGVGVVATQSFVNKSFGIKGLELLKEGKSPQEALDILLSDDEGRDFRQVAILDKQGRVATHTGKSCIDYAGHANGKDFSVQANMMLNDKVVPAMEKAWIENSEMPLAERMVAVLQAAQEAGGDIRGKQSAALVVFAGEASEEPWNDKLIDLRVDDSENPIKEIERLLKVFRAYEHMNEGDLYVEKNEMKNAMEAYNKAMEMFSENLEMQYWTAITLANDKQMEKASEMLQKIYAKDENWRELTRRLPKVGLLNISEENLKLLLR
ncbi:MAG: Zn-dependent protease [Aequorivita sp.]|nr:Zn-dependent protease [Aequorivita sp.]